MSEWLMRMKRELVPKDVRAPSPTPARHVEVANKTDGEDVR